jgi:hypothetical protein
MRRILRVVRAIVAGAFLVVTLAALAIDLSLLGDVDGTMKNGSVITPPGSRSSLNAPQR